MGTAKTPLRFVGQSIDGLFGSECASIRPIGCHRIEEVGHSHDLRQQGNVVAAESVGVATAIEQLVVMTYDLSHELQRTKLAAQTVSNHSVPLHRLEFRGGGVCGLQESVHA